MDTVKIGAFIKAQRNSLNMTQKELAEKIGCTDKAISRWETGKGLPDSSFLIPLSQELNISVNELLMGEKIIPEKPFAEEKEIVSEIIKKNDETLVSVINENQRKIKNHKKISAFLLILMLVQMAVFFVIPNFFPISVEPVEVIIVLSALTSTGVGLSKNRLKWLFPLVISLVFFLINLCYRTEEGFLGFFVSLLFAVGSMIIIALISLVTYLINKIK